MSKMARLLRVAAARNKQSEYTGLRVRILKDVKASLLERCEEDGITVCALMEALTRGFINKHPSALAMVDQWIRDEGLETKPVIAPNLNRNEIAQIYARIGMTNLTEE